MLQGLTKKAICAKKLKGLNNFFNAPKLSILYRNMNRKALKRLLFVDSVVFQQLILIISPWTYISIGLKVGICIRTRVSLNSGGPISG